MITGQLCFYVKRYRSVGLIFISVIISLIISNSRVVWAADDDVSSREFGGEVIQYAENFIGKPYVFGAEGPEAFDCSGLTKHVYERFNIDLPHYTGTQWGCGKGVCRNDLKEGDLVFFNTVGNLSHVGIYIGNNNFIHAPSKGKTVRINSLNESYYKECYAGARRVA